MKYLIFYAYKFSGTLYEALNSIHIFFPLCRRNKKKKRRNGRDNEVDLIIIFYDKKFQINIERDSKHPKAKDWKAKP